MQNTSLAALYPSGDGDAQLVQFAQGLDPGRASQGVAQVRALGLQAYAEATPGERATPARAIAARSGDAGPCAAAAAVLGYAGTGDRAVSASAPLAYAWVRSHGAMLSEVGGEPVLLGTADTAAWAVASCAGMARFRSRCWMRQPGSSAGEQYRDGGDAAAVVGAPSEVDLDRLMQDMPEVTDLLDAQDDAPVIRMINALLAQAARRCQRSAYRAVRDPFGGALPGGRHAARHGSATARTACNAGVAHQIMAHLDIAEKRLPQDGRIAIRVGEAAGHPCFHCTDRAWRARRAAIAGKDAGACSCSGHGR